MRKTKSTRIVASAGLSGELTVALLAKTFVESPGMSKRNSSLVAWAVLRPDLISAVVVSNAAVPGSPAVSFAGNVSFVRCQMSPLMLPSDTADEALAWPGTPGWSTNGNETWSSSPPSLELHPSVMANRKHPCVWLKYNRPESGRPLGFEVRNGEPLSKTPSQSVKHCCSGLKAISV